jgi:hypothetical protein
MGASVQSGEAASPDLQKAKSASKQRSILHYMKTPSAKNKS